MLNQPKAVWAVALTAMIAFMGLGLVDPILPMISAELGTTTTQTSLLFTSYLVITAVGMFFTSAISSRLGSRTTLLLGLTIIVLGAAGAGFSGSIGEIIAFRAVWGLGNALFISTALATIINESRGSSAGAIIMYEAALGLGLAVGPLLGGFLGGISWRGPFFGTAVLMATGAVLLAVLLRAPGRPARPSPVLAAFGALRHRALLVMAIVALFYNMGFFVLMSFTPYPLGLPAMGIGLVFAGWGLALAITSVFVAPILTRRWAPVRVLTVTLGLLTLTMAGFALVIDHLALLIVGMVVAGLELGIMNTVMTEVVMDAADVPRQVASSAYSGVRFLGGAIAPPLATALAAGVAMSTPYWFAALALLVAAGLLIALRHHLAHGRDVPDEERVEAAVLTGEGAVTG